MTASTLPPIDLVIFDCDGVLADSEVISARVLVQELALIGVTTDADYVYRNFVGKSFPKVVDIIRDTFQVAIAPGFEQRYRASLLSAFATGLAPTAGIADVLAALGCASCVASSSSPPRLARTLELCAMTDRFGDRSYTASQVANGKPAPDLFLFAARRMGFPPARCLVIEDSEAGLTAALAAGMTVWRYTGGAHFPDPPSALTGALADVQSFDNWAAFYHMAPELRRQGGRDG